LCPAARWGIQEQNPNFYINLHCCDASLPIRLLPKKNPSPKLPSRRLAFSKGEFFALGARGWLVGWHGTALGIVAMSRTRMGWALRHQTRSWCGARLFGPLNISHPCSSPEQAHAGHSQPLIGSGRLGLAARCRDNDVARGLAEACHTSPANQATPGHAAVHSAASPSCFTLCSLFAFLQPPVAVCLVSIHTCCNKQHATCSMYIIWRGDHTGRIGFDSERALRSSSR
jgi:hypothetical protein